jgi:hypothetical protein
MASELGHATTAQGEAAVQSAGSGRNDELQPQGKEPMDQEARQRKLWQIGNRVKKRNFFENGLNKAEKCR